MSDAYRTPSSDLVGDNFMDISISEKLIVTGCAIISFLIYLVFHKAVPQFYETFSAFDAELPELTLLVIKCHNLFIWLCIISLFPLVVWIKLKIKYRFRRYLFRSSLIYALFSIVLFPIVVYSMYLPIFDLGNMN